jgi:hypothetical protein
VPLLPEDAKSLRDRQIPYQISEEGGMTCLVIPEWILPAGLDRPQTDVLIRLAAGYPDLAPDMWWVDPPLRRGNGSTIPGTESHEFYLGRQWQRWSRHFQPGQWQPGIDRLESYLTLIGNEFRRMAEGAA